MFRIKCLSNPLLDYGIFMSTQKVCGIPKWFGSHSVRYTQVICLLLFYDCSIWIKSRSLTFSPSSGIWNISKELPQPLCAFVLIDEKHLMYSLHNSNNACIKPLIHAYKGKRLIHWILNVQFVPNFAAHLKVAVDF